MSTIITLDNYEDAIVQEKTALAVEAPAAAVTVTVQNPNNVSANRFMLIGRQGGENSELKQISSVAVNVVTIGSALAYRHLIYDDVSILLTNQLRVYRATYVANVRPLDTDFALLGSGTVDMDPDDLQTKFLDDTGGSGYWYKFTHYNSASSYETPLADCDPIRGTDILDYCSIADIKWEAGLRSNRNISDATIHAKRQAAQQEVNATLTGLYTVPFSQPINPLIRNITSMLAAGMLLLDNYGPINTLNTNNGQQKIDAARALLKRLDTRELKLTDPNTGADQSTSTSLNFDMYPDETTADLDRDSGGRMFTTIDRY